MRIIQLAFNIYCYSYHFMLINSTIFYRFLSLSCFLSFSNDRHFKFIHFFCINLSTFNDSLDTESSQNSHNTIVLLLYVNVIIVGLEIESDESNDRMLTFIRRICILYMDRYIHAAKDRALCQFICMSQSNSWLIESFVQRVKLAHYYHHHHRRSTLRYCSPAVSHNLMIVMKIIIIIMISWRNANLLLML